MKRNLLSLDSKVCITSDIWTSSANDPYLSVTCYFIDNEWNLNNFLLDVFHFPDPHDGCFIYDAKKELCEDFSIFNKILSITTDNAVNAVLSGELMNADNDDIIHVRCAAHILNIVVQEVSEHEQTKNSIEKIRYFCKKIHSSSKLVQYLENQAESNSTIELSHEKKIVSSSLYPCLKTIDSHLNGILKNGEYEFIKRALDGMMEKFKKYHQKVIDHALIYEKRNAKNLIENLFELYSINAKVDSQNQDSLKKSKKKESIVCLTQQYLAKVTKTKATNEDEIDRFFKKPQVEYCPNYDVLG
ncbi:unnamed protein product [Brachionus calyciflorus]|uniref:Uncharacterized protein n=1 Tax=Brachionus calyciflorus TaxID=104777 RepID=A0A814MJV1_9BILA|nr:unnamed protein product [Brachionus calyciflorus]